jgi:uncharacterized damage-inducible protein DinB
MLLAFNDQQRAALLWKLEGLSDEQLRARHDVTGFSLLGLLKHLVRVEQTWFQQRLIGEAVDGGPNDDTAWNPTSMESFEVLAGQYRLAWARSNEIARTLPLDHHTVVASTVSLQWVLLHMIEETARHLGHADVIRQSIDGATGVNAHHEQRRQGASNR